MAQVSSWNIRQVVSSVVYLRSFQDEAITSEASNLNAWWPFNVETGEEALVKALQQAGPVIAIGRPGEHLPELGARRIYFDDGGWMDAATELISRARLVVLRIGRTGGLWWEVQTSIRSARPERLLFVVPNHQENYREFCQKFNQEFADTCTLPVNLPLADYGVSSLAGFIRFDTDWSPQFVRFTSSSVRSMRKALRTVFHRIGSVA